MNMTSLVSRIAQKIDAIIRLLCWKILQPKIFLLSGTATVRSDSDWEVANEIFVHKEYDDAILQTVHTEQQQQTRPLRIVDLGANVGFFTLRCIHLYLQTKCPAPLEVFAVEASANLFADLERRLSGRGDENVKLLLKNGLVGRRTGKAMFHSSWFNSATNQVSRDHKVSRNPLLNRYAEVCEYTDLEQFLPAECEIDLIKCDIEGSELTFLENYPDLLRRTRRLVIELHP